MLCQFCQSIKLLEGKREVFSNYPNAAYLKTAGEQGCVTCFVVHERYAKTLVDPGYRVGLTGESITVRWTIEGSTLMSWIPPRLHVVEAGINLVVKSGT